MTLYQQKLPKVEATVYGPTVPAFVSFVVTPQRLLIHNLRPEENCDDCGSPWADHAWLGDDYDGGFAHPGDYIVTLDQWGNEGMQPIRPGDFEFRWEASPTS